MADELNKKKPDLGSGSSSESAPKQAPTPKPASNPNPAPKQPSFNAPKKTPEQPKQTQTTPAPKQVTKPQTQPAPKAPEIKPQAQPAAKPVTPKEPSLKQNPVPKPKVDPVRQKIMDQGFAPKSEEERNALLYSEKREKHLPERIKGASEEELKQQNKQYEAEGPYPEEQPPKGHQPSDRDEDYERSWGPEPDSDEEKMSHPGNKSEDILKGMGFEIEKPGDHPEDDERDQYGWNISKEYSAVSRDTYNRVHNEVQQKMKEAGLSEEELVHAWADGYSAESYPFYEFKLDNGAVTYARMRPDGTFAIHYIPENYNGVEYKVTTLARGLTADQMVNYFKQLKESKDSSSGGEQAEREQASQLYGTDLSKDKRSLFTPEEEQEIWHPNNDREKAYVLKNMREWMNEEDNGPIDEDLMMKAYYAADDENGFESTWSEEDVWSAVEDKYNELLKKQGQGQGGGEEQWNPENNPGSAVVTKELSDWVKDYLTKKGLRPEFVSSVVENLHKDHNVADFYKGKMKEDWESKHGSKKNESSDKSNEFLNYSPEQKKEAIKKLDDAFFREEIDEEEYWNLKKQLQGPYIRLAEEDNPEILKNESHPQKVMEDIAYFLNEWRKGDITTGEYVEMLQLIVDNNVTKRYLSNFAERYYEDERGHREFLDPNNYDYIYNELIDGELERNKEWLKQHPGSK